MTRRRKPKLNREGRALNEQFVKLPFYMLNCDAYRSLKPGPRSLLVEFHRRFNGRNNGKIIFSQREMSEAINIADRQTVAKYVRELEEKGFVHAIRRGGFNLKSPDESRATVWALSMYAVGDKPAQKTFMRWRPKKISGKEKPTPKEGISSRDGKTHVPDRSNVKEFPSVNGKKPSDPRAENPSTYTSIAIGTGV